MTVVESATRFTEPATEPRRRRRWWLVAVGLVVVIAGVTWLLGWSTVLSVKEVRVLGTRTLSTDQVRIAAGVALGTPLARVSAADVSSRVADLPQVAAVEVRHGWPDVVVVVVTERQPVAVVAGSAGFALVDGGGTVFDEVARRPADLPELLAEGDAVASALQVLTAVPPELRDRVVKVRAATADDVVLVLGNGTKVHWGSPTDIDLKSEVMLALLPRKAAEIDVSAPSLPTTRATR
jgi:cell division protein FtsQ